MSSRVRRRRKRSKRSRSQHPSIESSIGSSIGYLPAYPGGGSVMDWLRPYAKSRPSYLLGITAGVLAAGLWAVIVVWPYLFGSGRYVDIIVADDTDGGDGFGSSVALSENWLAVGAFRDSDVFKQAGAVYVARRSGAQVDQFQKLVGPNPRLGDQAGFSVAMDDRWLAVGRVGQFGRLAAESNTQGSVDMYTHGSEGWQLHSTLVRPGGMRNDRFGFSAAISGDWLAVGARGVEDDRGAVVLYRLSDLDSAVTNPFQIVMAPTPAAGDRFGEAVSLAGRTLAVGAPGSTVDGNVKAAGLTHVFMFAEDEQAWLPDIDPIQAAAPEAGAKFGASVATDGEHLLVGASHWRAGVREGSLWASARDNGTGRFGPMENIPVPTTSFGDMDGYRVTIDGAVAIASAHLADAKGRDSGNVILLNRTADGWSYAGRRAPVDGNRNDHYGIALAMKEGMFVVGAEMADASGRKSGGIYLESLPTLP